MTWMNVSLILEYFLNLPNFRILFYGMPNSPHHSRSEGVAKPIEIFPLLHIHLERKK